MRISDWSSDVCSSDLCASPLQLVVGQLMPGLPVLDGSRSACEWGTDADAPAPGIFGPSNLPTLDRDDYVGNFNDRSEERRVGKEGVSTCRYRWVQYH